MTTQTPTAIDKSTWGDGLWQSEPDRVEWEHAGLPCLAARSEIGGNWCGYAAVPPRHPLHGKDYGDIDVTVHGGLTYAAACDGHICHVPKSGEPDDVWWFGFDCGHAFDLMPALNARLRQSGYRELCAYVRHQEYRTLEYVCGEVNQLAEQLRDLSS